MNTSEQNLDHPIFRPLDFYIPTPMIEALQTQVTQWLWCGQTGGYIVGRARIGKSRAIRKATQQLRTRSGHTIPTFCMNCGKRDVPTIANMFRTLKHALGLKVTSRAVADEMSDDLVAFLAEAGLANPQREVVLVVDEAQRTTLKQLYAFAELYDALVDLHTNLFVLFVLNNGESETLLQSLREPVNEQLRGRFFTHGSSYFGLRNHQEVQACLRQYDTLHYPIDGGPTITGYFLPFARGWRLESLSATVWRIYAEEFQKPLQLTSWGMQYFTAAVKTLLVDYLPAYGMDNLSEVEDMVRHSIDVSGIVPALVSVES